MAVLTDHRGPVTSTYDPVTGIPSVTPDDATPIAERRSSGSVQSILSSPARWNLLLLAGSMPPRRRSKNALHSVNQPRPENPRFSGGFRRIDSFIAPDLRLEVGSNRSPSRPGTRRLPADRRRSRPGSGAPLRGRGSGRRPSPPSTVRGVAATGSSPDQVRLERGRLDAGDRVVGEGILTRPRRPARIEEGAEGGSAPARVLKAGGRGQCIVSPSSPSSRSASSASASTIPT